MGKEEKGGWERPGLDTPAGERCRLRRCSVGRW